MCFKVKGKILNNDTYQHQGTVDQGEVYNIMW
jgi:hypothetical protein